MFQMENPLIRMLTKIGGFMMVSFYWLLTCIPVVTILPACAALYHTVTRVIRRDGEGVTREYFSAFRDALNPGVLLSVIVVAVSLLLYTCVDFGRQLMDKNAFYLAYFAVGCVLSLVWVATVVYMPAALARFRGGVGTILRIAFYLPSRNFLGVFVMCGLLAVMVLAVEFYPLLLMVVPALYTDLISPGVEKALAKFMTLNGLADDETPDETAPRPDTVPAEEFSALEQAARMEEEAE